MLFEEGKSVTFNGEGKVIDGDSSFVRQQFVYKVENLEGSSQLHRHDPRNASDMKDTK